MNGKNEAYMANLIDAAEQAARQVFSAPKEGTLYCGKVLTENMLRDSRHPEVADENLYQLRFAPRDGDAGVRMLFYCVHAESLRGNNRTVGRDYPGLLCVQVTEAAGEIFPELAYGGQRRQMNPDGVNPEPLKEIAARYGAEEL